VTKILTRVRGILQRRRVAREVDDELHSHVEMETRSNIERGMEPIELDEWLLNLGGIVRPRRRFGT
jgi:hypothetical protein